MDLRNLDNGNKMRKFGINKALAILLLAVIGSSIDIFAETKTVKFSVNEASDIVGAETEYKGENIIRPLESVMLSDFKFEFGTATDIDMYLPSFHYSNDGNYVELTRWSTYRCEPSIKVVAPQGYMMSKVVFYSTSSGANPDFIQVSQGGLVSSEKNTIFTWTSDVPTDVFEFATTGGFGVFKMTDVEITYEETDIPELPETVQFQPEQNSYVPSCEEIIITYPEPITYLGQALFIYKSNSTVFYSCQVEVNYNQLIIKPIQKLGKGEWAITIDNVKSVKTGEAVKNETLRFNIGEPPAPPTPITIQTIYPEEGVISKADAFKMFILTFAEGVDLQLNEECKEIPGLVIPVDGEEGTVVMQYNANPIGNLLTLRGKTTVPTLASTTYNLVIPAGFLKSENLTNERLVFTFEYMPESGIETLESDSLYSVYSPSGMLIQKGADSDAVRTLPKGIYILVSEEEEGACSHSVRTIIRN